MPKLPELASIPMRGIDHLAFVTDDLPATMDFYTRVLGMQLVHVRRVPFEQDRGQPPYDNLRHYFFNMGNDTLLAFFVLFLFLTMDICQYRILELLTILGLGLNQFRPRHFCKFGLSREFCHFLLQFLCKI